ncbi:hypothetical protein BDFB_009452 [Asbolus verrucosus]|uniref:Uncharacterized protein n=1 Tax=Asbolus verrucosus TaxID=1661398 RepID=A0A482VSL4_ASBVE|nr:hypothetical protein BDFB_009452 [Asbolus verrucosus]
MAVCGPKLSMCCMMLSVWGVLQLGLMGVFYYIHAVSLAEDVPAELPEEPTPADIEQFYKDLDAGYSQLAYNCWIAAGMYVAVLLISVQQFRANARL